MCKVHKEKRKVKNGTIMFNFKSVEKKYLEEIANVSMTYNKTIIKRPLYCPICDLPQNPIRINANTFEIESKIQYAIVKYECNACLKGYLAIYEIDIENCSSVFKMFYPSVPSSFNDKIIEKTSPRFIKMYNQALASEKLENTELAAIGFRAALEILIKDYAVNELGASLEEVEKKTLHKAISDHLDSELVKSADVVRILGNDNTHYVQQYPEHDFEVLKDYMDIFISQIRVKLKIKYPPVAR